MTTTFEPVQHEQPTEHRARYGDREFCYRLCYVPAHYRRSIRVHVHPSGTVQVDTPEDAPLSDIKAAVQRRARWVLKHLDDIEERNRDVLPRQWVSGESALYLGRRYVLKTIQDHEQSGLVCKLISGQLRVYGNDLTPDRVQKAVWKWYQEHALVVFQRRLSIMIEALPWTKNSPPWRMKEMQTQWGSCSPAGTVLLNPHLIKAPIKAIDYVLLHELCHLVEHNHSPKFYALLNQIMPDWRSVKERLDGSAELILTPSTRNR